jgi:hypothetical protein
MGKRTYTKESDVKAEIKKLLNKHKWYWWMPPANGFGKAGVSDFNALRDGVFIVIEAKFGGNKPTALQVAYMNSIMAAGGIAFVVDEKRIEQFAGWLEAFDRSAQATAAKQKVSDEDGALMLNALRDMTCELV